MRGIFGRPGTTTEKTKVENTTDLRPGPDRFTASAEKDKQMRPPRAELSPETIKAQHEARLFLHSRDEQKLELQEAKSRFAINQLYIKDFPEYAEALEKHSNALRDLKRFYIVRNLDETGKKEEIDFIGDELLKLATEFNNGTATEARKTEIQKRMQELQSWLESLMANPTGEQTIDTRLFLHILLILHILSPDLPLVSTAEKTPEVSPETGAELGKFQALLEENSRQIFGELDQNTQGSILAQGRDNQWISSQNMQERLPLLRGLVEASRAGLTQTHDPTQKAVLESNVLQYQRELSLLEAETSTRKGVDRFVRNPIFTDIEQINTEVSIISQNLENLNIQHDAAKRKANLSRYHDLERQVSKKNQEIAQLSKRLKERQNDLKPKDPEGAGLTPLEKSKTEQDLSGTQSQLDRLLAEFRWALLDLERFEHELNIQYEGADPFPEKNTAQAAYDWAVSWAGPAENTRKSQTELMLEYHLARNGMISVSEAYQDAIPTSLDALKATFSLETLKSFQELIMKRPSIARQLAADLMHTYSILYASEPTILNAAKRILQRKTAENYVTDALLGERESLLSRESKEPMMPAEIALVDLASRAPYLAGAYMGTQARNLGGTWMQTALSWIPVIGEYRPLQQLAGAAGGIAQVYAEKQLAARISRSQEVYANSMLMAFDALPSRGFRAAIQESVTYAAARAALQQAGNLVADTREVSAGHAAKNLAKRHLPRSVLEGLTQVGFGGAAAYAAGLLGVTIGGPVVLVGAATAAAATLGSALVSHIADYVDPKRASARIREETMERLQKEEELLKTATLRIKKEKWEQISKTSESEREGAIAKAVLEQLNLMDRQRLLETAWKLPQDATQTSMLSALADRNWKEMKAQLPALAEERDNVENAVYNQIVHLENLKTPLSREDIQSLSDDIITLRLCQLEFRAKESGIVHRA